MRTIMRGRENVAERRRLKLPANLAPCDVTQILSSADSVLLPADAFPPRDALLLSFVLPSFQHAEKK